MQSMTLIWVNFKESSCWKVLPQRNPSLILLLGNYRPIFKLSKNGVQNQNAQESNPFSIPSSTSSGFGVTSAICRIARRWKISGSRNKVLWWLHQIYPQVCPQFSKCKTWKSNTREYTPPRSPRISRLKAQIMKPTFLS